MWLLLIHGQLYMGLGPLRQHKFGHVFMEIGVFKIFSLSLQRAPSELSSHQKKILHIDDHVGVAIAGLTADARGLR